MTHLTTGEWTVLMESVAQIMVENADHLCQMDANMGDGDLGLTMKKGYSALPALYDQLEEADMGKRLSKAGMKMASIVPSTMGTLMASGWMEGGKALVGVERVDAAAFAAFLAGFAQGVMKRGKCAPGERTVLDALLPAAQGAQETAAAGGNLMDTAQVALTCAQRGLEATKEMSPKYGKAAVFAAKAIGIPDQGATAGMLLIQGLCHAIQQEKEGTQ